MSNRKMWTMWNGDKIRIKDMSDSHLLNTIAMLLRNATFRRMNALACFPSFNGEMAQFSAEQDWDNLNEMSDEEYAMQTIPLYKDMIEEALHRKLPVSV